MKTFYTSSGPRLILMLLVGYLIIFAPVIAMIIDPSGANIDFSGNWYFALFPILIFLFFLYVITASVLKMFIKFTISPKGISIYKPLFHSKHVRMEEIDELSYLNEKETSHLIRDSILEQESFKDSMDIFGYFNMIKKKSPAYKYFTNAASAEVTAVGPKERLTSLKVKSGGEIIFLKLKNGDYYYLTPAKPLEFKMYADQMKPQLSTIILN